MNAPLAAADNDDNYQFTYKDFIDNDDDDDDI